MCPACLSRRAEAERERREVLLRQSKVERDKTRGREIADAFKIEDFNTKSTLSWALEKCIEGRERFLKQWLMMEPVASIFAR